MPILYSAPIPILYLAIWVVPGKAILIGACHFSTDEMCSQRSRERALRRELGRTGLTNSGHQSTKFRSWLSLKTRLFRVGSHPERSRLSGGGRDLPPMKSERGRSLGRLKCAAFRDDPFNLIQKIQTEPVPKFSKL